MSRVEPEMVYIMGRGHSGSTVLDGLLGSLPDVESVGELVSGLSRADAVCSCGAEFADCPYWRAVVTRFETDATCSWSDAASTIVTYSHVRWFLHFLAGDLTAIADRYIERSRGVLHSVSSVAGKRLVVDSSKEPTRAFLLARAGAKIIHLIRDPRDILESNYWRLRSGRGFRYLRRTYHGRRFTGLFLALSAVSWLAGSWLAAIVRRAAPERFLRVKFEDLCSDPRRELGRIGAFLGTDVQLLIEAVEQHRPLSIGHNLGGNHMRHQKTFIFQTPSRNGRELPRRYRWMPAVLCWPTRANYGYPPRVPRDSAR